MKDIKIVFFDIDGTLFDYSVGIPKDTVCSIKKLKENGHIPVICTGRTKVMILDEFLSPGFDYIIGGAGTYVEENNNQIFYSEMKNTEVKDVCNGLLKYGFSPVIEGRDNLYVEVENKYRDQRHEKIIQNYRKSLSEKCIDMYSVDNYTASKVSAVYTSKSDENGMIRDYSDRYTVIRHRKDMLELIPKKYSKATGIEFLLEKLNIPRENTFAFGDSFNDLEMLRYVNYGIAMGNSDMNLFSKVKYKTDDFDKGGITNALKRFNLI